MTEKANYERARKRAKDKLDFYNHLMVYVIVNALIFGINLFTSPGYIWAVWPLMGWGVGLAFHGAIAFFRTEDPALLDEMTERELKKIEAREASKDKGSGAQG